MLPFPVQYKVSGMEQVYRRIVLAVVSSLPLIISLFYHGFTYPRGGADIASCRATRARAHFLWTSRVKRCVVRKEKQPITG